MACADHRQSDTEKVAKKRAMVAESVRWKAPPRRSRSTAGNAMAIMNAVRRMENARMRETEALTARAKGAVLGFPSSPSLPYSEARKGSEAAPAAWPRATGAVKICLA